MNNPDLTTRFHTLSEAALLLDLTKQQVHTRVKNGLLDAFVTSGGLTLIREDSIKEYLDMAISLGGKKPANSFQASKMGFVPSDDGLPF